MFVPLRNLLPIKLRHAMKNYPNFRIVKIGEGGGMCILKLMKSSISYLQEAADLVGEADKQLNTCRAVQMP